MTQDTLALVDSFNTKLKDIIAGTPTIRGQSTDVNVEIFTTRNLIEIVEYGKTVLADGKIGFFELVGLIRVVSAAVQNDLNIYKKANHEQKTVIVREVVKYLVDQLIPDGKAKATILNDAILDAVIKLVYHLLVKGN